MPKKNIDKTKTVKNKINNKLKGYDKRKEIHLQKISMEAKEKTKYKSNAINKGIKVVVNCIIANTIHMCFPVVIQAANQKIK